jgi:hypothetical protein
MQGVQCQVHRGPQGEYLHPVHTLCAKHCIKRVPSRPLEQIVFNKVRGDTLPRNTTYYAARCPRTWLPNHGIAEGMADGNKQ